MNRRPPDIDCSKAIDGFIKFKTAEGLSPRTIESYSHDLKMWLENNGDGDVLKVTTNQLRDYLVYLTNDYTPRRITGGNENKLSPKTIRNHWISLSGFFSIGLVMSSSLRIR